MHQVPRAPYAPDSAAVLAVDRATIWWSDCVTSPSLGDYSPQVLGLKAVFWSWARTNYSLQTPLPEPNLSQASLPKASVC